MPDSRRKSAESEQQKGGSGSVPIQRQQIGKRMEEAAAKLGSRKAAASILEVSVDSLRRYLKGEISPDAEFLGRLADATGYSVDYLVAGRTPEEVIEWSDARAGTGPRTVGDKVVYPAKGTRPTEVRRVMTAQEPGGDDEQFVYVPRYDIEASAGGGAEVQSEQIVDYLAFRRDWVLSQGFEPRQLALIEALGDSMAPTIEDKDLVLVDLSHRTLGRPGVYVLRRDHTLLAKRLEVRWDGPGVIVRSDSPAYDDQTLDEHEASQLQILGRVVWLARRL